MSLRDTPVPTAPEVRRRLSLATALLLCLGVLVGVGAAPPAGAVQATGDDVQAWAPGWSWTYATSFRYQADGTDVTINEDVTYSVAGVETYQGHEAYKMNISGAITGGSGSVAVDGIGNASLSNFSGSVSGTRYVRVSDRALLQEKQVQNLNAKASVAIISANISAQINLELNPTPSWKTHDFPLNAGDTWQHAELINYTGGFSYDAGSIGGSGSDTFAGDLPFTATASVSNESLTTPIGTNATKRIHAQTADGSMSDTIWYSPNHKNDARQVLVLPLDGAKLTLTRNLAQASTPAPSLTTTAVATPSLTCAGNTVTVAGRLSSFAAGVPVTVTLDQSQVSPGQKVQASTTTVANGDWSTTLTVPAQSDGLQKNGSRANWGVVAKAGNATATTTVVVTPKNCTSLEWTGDTSAPHGTDAQVSARLRDLTGASASGRQVTFSLGGGASVTATTDANGVASALLPVNLPVRNTTVTASFAGTTGLEAASTSTPFDVERTATTTTVVPSESPATLGEDLTFTAHVSGAGAVAGDVQFVVDGANFGAPRPLANGSATSAAISTLALGDHTVNAIYLGNAENAGSESGPVAFRVRMPLVNTTTTSTATPSSVHYGQQVELGATVTRASGTEPLTGEVTFSRGGTVIGTVPVDANGQASLVVDDLPAGTHAVVASYSGDDAHRASSAAPRSVTVAKAQVDVQLTASSTTSVAGEAVHHTVDVTTVAPAQGTPTGTVQLRVNGTNVGAPVALVGGTAVFPALDSLGAGTHVVSAVYAGTTNFEGAQAQVQHQVSRAQTTTTVLVNPSPSAEGQNITVTADVAAVAPGSGAPTGLVSFTSDGDLIGATSLQPSAGGAQAVIQLADLEAGTHEVEAQYVGDTNYEASASDQVQHTVIPGVAIVPTTTVVTSSTNPANHGELISFTATVVADDDTVPTGMVQFSVDGTNLGGQVVVDGDGVAHSTTISAPEPGDHTVVAAFIPDAGYGGSGDFLTQTVAAAGVDLQLTSSDDSSEHGQSVRFTASVASAQVGTGEPTGFVQFRIDGQPFGAAVPVEDGEARSAATSTLAPGTHEVTAVYSGDVHFAPATATITQTVAAVGTSTTLAASATSTTYGSPVTLTATVSPAAGALGNPNGTVSFVRGTTTLATVPVAAGSGNTAKATFTSSDLGAGTHGIKAVYSGSDAFAGSSSGQVNLTVAKRATSISADAAVVKLLPLGLPLGSLRATLRSGSTPLSGLPLQFKIGNTTVCTLTTDASGVATCNAAAHLVTLILSGGYKVAFAGDANHLAANANGVLLK